MRGLIGQALAGEELSKYVVLRLGKVQAPKESGFLVVVELGPALNLWWFSPPPLHGSPHFRCM